MCLYMDPAETKKYKAKHKGKTIKVYKLVKFRTRRLDGEELKRPFVAAPFRETRIKAGTFDSGVRTTVRKAPSSMSTLYNRVTEGIHVYRTKGRLQQSIASYTWGLRKGIVCTAKVSDLIGMCGTHMVFRKIEIPKEELDRVRKEFSGG